MNGYANTNVIINSFSISEGLADGEVAEVTLVNSALANLEFSIIKTDANNSNKLIDGTKFKLVYEDILGNANKNIVLDGYTENGVLTFDIADYNLWLGIIDASTSDAIQNRTTEDLSYLQKKFKLYEVSSSYGYAMPDTATTIPGTQNEKGAYICELQIDYRDELHVEITDVNENLSEEVKPTNNNIQITSKGFRLELSNEKETDVGNLKITKVDSENSDTENNLSAIFNLIYANGENVVDINGNTIGNIITNANGEIEKVYITYSGDENETEVSTNIIENIPVGKYYLKEIKAPLGYKAVTEDIEVDILENATTSKEVENTQYKSKIIIKKVDEEGKTLSGAKFKITNKDTNEVIYESIEVGSTGILEINIAPGKYTIEEIEPPVGYTISNTSEVVALKNDTSEVTITFENKTNYNVASLRLKKKVANYVQDVYLEGAKFTIEKEENGTFVTATDINGGIVGTLEDINGTQMYVVTTSANGTIEIKNLQLGKYRITEVMAPSGYAISADAAKIVDLTEEKTYEYEFENESLSGSLKINKVITGTTQGLENAIFKLYTDEAFTNEAYDIYGYEIGQIVTDENGKATVEKLAVGTYYLKEISAPIGYSSLETKIVNIIYSQETEVTISDDKLYGDLKIIKKEKLEDGSFGDVLSGAKFIITQENGLPVITDIFGNQIGEEYNGNYGVLTSDENGEIIVNNLPVGKYKITEIETLEGYTIEDQEKEKEVEIRANSTETVEVTFGNREAVCDLTIIKYEEINENVISTYLTGIEFYLEELDEDGNVVKTINTTNADGTGEAIITKTITTNVKEIIVDEQGEPVLDEEGNIKYQTVAKEVAGVTVYGLKSNTEYRIVERSNESNARYVLPDYENMPIVSIYGEKEQTVKIGNNPKTGLVVLTKVETGTTTGLEGAVFAIIPINAYSDAEAATVEEYGIKDWFKYEEPEISTNSNIRVVAVTNEDGIATVDLPIGEYYVKEITAPDGYALNNTITKIKVVHYKDLKIGSGEQLGTYETITENGVSYTIMEVNSDDDVLTTPTENPNNEERTLTSVANLTIENTAEKGQLKIIKKDSNGNLLNGVKFKIYKDVNGNGEIDDEDFVRIESTNATGSGANSNGEIIIENIEFGDYIIEEIVAQAGYDTTKLTSVKVVATAENVYTEVTITNELIQIPVKIIKKDANDENKLLSGAVFNVYKVGDETKEVIKTITTDANGKGETTLPYGDYYIVEQTPPEGYVSNGEEIQLNVINTLSEDGYLNGGWPDGYAIEIIAKNVLDGGNIKIIKTDGENTTQNLTGAKFDLYACEVTELTEVPEASNWEDGITYALTADYKVVKYKAQEKISEITDDKTAGEYEFNNVSKGEYILIETKAPEGYLLETTPNLIKVEGAKIGNNNTIIQETVEVPITNVKGKIKLIKYEDGTTYTISNVKFKVYKQQDTNGAIDETEKENAIELVTDENGRAEVSLDKGLYILEEIETPKGYVLSGQKYIFNLNEETKEAVLYELTADETENSTIAGKVYLGETSDLTSISVARDENGNNIINNKLQDIDVTLKKVNLKGDPLAGASFKIYKALRDSNGNYREGTYIKENNTYYLKYSDENQEEQTEEITLELVEQTEESTLLADKEGIIELSEKIPYGKYIIEEVNVPKNYARIDDLIVIDLTEETENIEVQSFEIENTLQLGSFEIKKYEGANGVSTQVVSGAEFKIYKATGSVEENVLDEEENETGEKITKYTYSTEPENVTIKEASAIPGTYYCEGVTAGRYILKETVTPNGYIACEPIEFEIITIGDYDKETKAEILISGETETTNTIKVTNDLRVGNLKITKVSDVTKEPVAGVRFEVVATDLEKGTIIVSKVTDPTSTDGVTIIENLPIGTYTIKEIEETVMDGYYVAEDITGVIIEDSQNAEGNTYTPLITLQTIENKKQVRDIKIIKKDQFDKTISGGATFELYKLDSNGNRIKVTEDAYGNEITNFTTDENGVLEIKNLQSSVAGETYILKEIEAPFGYIQKGTGEKEIKLQHANQTEEITDELVIEITNEKIIFDLGLEKWVSKVSTIDGEEISYDDRNTQDAGVEGREGDIEVTKGDIVTYTIRVFNHGNIDAYATKILDTLPEGLEIVEPTYDEEGNATNLNALYGWEIDENTLKLYTNYLEDKIISKHIGTNGNTAHDGLNYSTSEEAIIANACDNCAYQEVKLEVRVTDCYDKIVNIAQIAETKTPYDSEDKKIEDIDSIPDSYKDSDYREEEGKSREDDEDIAVIVPRKFNLELKKWISKYTVIVGKDSKEYVTTQTSETSDKEKSEDKIVKIDIKSNKVNKTDVIINYNIRVTNNGDLEGYVNEITDYIPQGLEFVQEDNISETGEEYWTLNGTDQIVTGDAYNKVLENTLLQPGEYIEVSVKLRWVQDVENFGLITNYAEISKDRNIYNVKDYNSTTNNFIETTDEDDTDKVPVYFAVETGEYMIKYFVIIGGLITVLFALVVMKRLMRKYSGSF